MKDRSNTGQPESDDRMRCRRCGCGHLPVSKTEHKHGSVYRYRKCRNCGWTTTTREKIARPE